MTTQTLTHLFKFTPDDLADNRRGHLSAAQQARWAEAGQWSGAVMRTAVPLLAATLITLIGIASSLFLSKLMEGVIISLIAAGIIGLGVRQQARRNGRNNAFASITAVRCAAGTAKLTDEIEYNEHSASRRYRLEIENHTFQLFTKEQFEA